MVKFSLTGKLAKTMTPPVISNLAMFLETLPNNNMLHGLNSLIWNNLSTFLTKNGLDEEIIFDNILSELQVHLIVLNNLRSPEVKKIKNLRVTFEKTEEVISKPKPNISEHYKTDLTNFVDIVLQFYLNKTKCPEVGHMYINHICQVILAFKNYGVYKKLSQTLPVINDEPSSSSFRLYKSYVKTWINDDKVLAYNTISVIVGLLEVTEIEEERLIMIDDLNLVIKTFLII